MKKSFIFSLLLLISPNIKSEDKKAEERKYIKLENSKILLLDGVSGCLDGNAIEEILLVRKKVEEEKIGILDVKTKRRKGKCLYCGQNYGTAALMKIEEQLKSQINIEKDEKKKKEHLVKLETLTTCLKQARQNFIKATIKFMERIEPTKGHVIKLIEESCKKRNIAANNTVMLEWANTRPGNEEAIFNDKVKNFREFDKFLNQVFNFLGDLLKSCPKGREQFFAKHPELKKENVKK